MHAENFSIQLRACSIKQTCSTTLSQTPSRMCQAWAEAGQMHTHSERRVVWVSLRWCRTDSGHFGFISQAKVGQIPPERLSSFSLALPSCSLLSLWPLLFLLTLSPQPYDLFPFFPPVSFSSAWDRRPSLAVLIIPFFSPSLAPFDTHKQIHTDYTQILDLKQFPATLMKA